MRGLSRSCRCSCSCVPISAAECKHSHGHGHEYGSGCGCGLGAGELAAIMRWFVLRTFAAQGTRTRGPQPQDTMHFELVCLNSVGLISSCRFSTFCSHFPGALCICILHAAAPLLSIQFTHFCIKRLSQKCYENYTETETRRGTYDLWSLSKFRLKFVTVSAITNWICCLYTMEKEINKLSKGFI